MEKCTEPERPALIEGRLPCCLVLICFQTSVCKSVQSCAQHALAGLLLASETFGACSVKLLPFTFYCIAHRHISSWLWPLPGCQLAAGQLAGQARERRRPGGCRRTRCRQRCGATPPRQRGAGWRLGWPRLRPAPAGGARACSARLGRCDPLSRWYGLFRVLLV